ncbi:MAG TPA: hypothetical protein VNZ54_02580, partial [bacterium]|nr:hypothetical protein [bacterium]
PSVTDSYTASPTVTPTFTDSPTATPSFTASPSWTASPSSTQTPLVVPFHVSVAVFNSAGERVRTLYQGPAQTIPAGVALAGGSVVLAGSQAVQLNLNTWLGSGPGSLAWIGDNDNGQLVAGGAYVLQAAFTDNFGNVTTYSVTVQVLDAMAQSNLEILNSAGEVVWTDALRLTGGPDPALSLGAPVLALALDPATGTPSGRLGIGVGALQVPWDGRSSSGQFVAAGMYFVRLAVAEKGGATAVQVRQFQVVTSAAGKPPAAVTLAPNPWRGPQPLKIRYTPVPGCRGAAALYSLTGGRVAAGADPQGTGEIRIPAPGLAPGIYIVEFWQMDGPAALARSATKVAVVR